jgi:hypothetical protein
VFLEGEQGRDAPWRSGTSYNAMRCGAGNV